MPVRTMTRTARDNKYLHRDFHVSCDIGLAHVGKIHGPEGVRAYLRQFADSWLAPVAARVRSQGLKALAEYFQELYRAEEAEEVLHLTLDPDGRSLTVRIDACPGIAHMKKSGHVPSVWYRETTDTLYSRLAENAGLAFTLMHYCPDTGASAFRFSGEEAL